MTVAPTPSSDIEQLTETADRTARRRMVFTVLALISVGIYLVLSFIQFDLGAAARRWNTERASLFLLDTYAHKDHVTMRWRQPDKVIVAFEGGYNTRYKTPPDWYEDAGTGSRTVRFSNGGLIRILDDRVEMDWPDEAADKPQTFVFRRDVQGRPYVDGYQGRADALPDWIRATGNKVEVRPSLYARLQVYKSKVEVHRYELGWKYFWFDFDSPLSGKGPIDAINLMVSGDRVDPARSNAQLVMSEFLDNAQWRHGDVFFAMLETVLMAVLGTLLACFVGMPLAFLAARNITPLKLMRFGLRRLFDVLRGVDMLIWSLVFLRAFGPGLFTGIFAIAFTDAGTFGKLMSEAIENADDKQREGVKSTGASPFQVHRFGLVPQILPILISQTLYYLESNVRGAVIIGAMGAGGIGLQFLGALQSGNDFENVAYMALLVFLTVIMMDSLSAWLRRRLIGFDDKSDAPRDTAAIRIKIARPA